MQKVFYSLLLGLVALCVNGQDRTYRDYNMFGSENQKKVMVIPFEDRMFISDINKEIANRTGMSFDEIKSTFQEGLIQTIVEMGSDHANFIDPFELDEAEMYDVLGGIYSHLSYDYDLVVPMEEVKDKKLLDKIIKVEDPDQQGRGSYLEEGQIQSWYDGKERFMNARLNSNFDLTALMEEHDLDHLLVITELDIKVMRDVNRDVGQVWPRRVKVHFTIFDKDGKEHFGSAAYSYYEGEEKDIYTIIRKTFDYPAAQIISKMVSSDDYEQMRQPDIGEGKEAQDEIKKEKSGFSRLKSNLFGKE